MPPSAPSGKIAVKLASQGLFERSLRGIKWNYLGTVGRILAQLVGQIALARLLGPQPVGLFGYAVIVIGFGMLLTEMGLGAALIQTARIEDKDYATTCSRLIIVGCVAASGLYFASTWLATALFANPEAANVLRAVAPLFVLSAMTIPPASLLRRELRFKALQLTQLGSYVFGYLLIGIGVALAGGGVWSLVAAWFAQLASACLVMHLLVPGALVLGNPLRGLKLQRFGVVIMITNLVNWTVDSAAHLFVGRFYGAASLGLFTVANNLVRTPAEHLVVNLQSVLFPASARAQHNAAGLRRAYLTALAGVGLVALPIFTFAAMQADAIVLAMLGPKWIAAGALMLPIALAMIPHALMAISGPILSGAGEPGIELRVQTATAMIMVIVLTVAAQWSLAAVVWALATIFLLRGIAMTSALAAKLKLRFTDVLGALRGGVLLALLVAGASFGSDAMLEILDVEWPALLHIFVAFAVALTAVATVVLSWPKMCLNPALVHLGGHLLSACPGSLRWRIFARVRTCLAGSRD